MSIRCIPAVALATAALLLWVRLPAPLVAQETPLSTTAPISPATAAEPVPLSGGAADILKLSRAKVNDDVTVAFVQNGERRFSLSASEILYLRKEGVSDRVLTAMLSQSPTGGPAQQPAQTEAAAVTAAASAPQFVGGNTPTTSTLVETTPATTVHVVSSAPACYPFYDPWPYYWYDPWWPYWYPFFSFGFYWGDCHDDHCDNGHHGGHHPPPPGDGHHPPSNGDRPSRGGNPPPHGGRPDTGGQRSLQAARGGQPAGPNQTASSMASRPGAGGPVRTTPAGGRTSFWSGPGNSPAAVRTGGGQAQVASSQANQGAVPTRVWTGAASQGTSSRSGVSRNAATLASTSRSSAGPSPSSNRPGGQAANHNVAIPAASSQRSSVGPSHSYRSAGNLGSASRPSIMPSSGRTGNGSSFRGGGGFASAGAPRMSSGGGFRGGGGGGGRAR